MTPSSRPAEGPEEPARAVAQTTCKGASLGIVALKGRPCAVFNSDLRVRVQESDRSTYPDVTVVCTKQLTAADDENAIVNPTLIVEVLSDSTEASDRGEKFAHLQRLPSLKEYVLVTQREQRVEVFRRGEGMWMLFTITSGRLELKSIDVALDLADVYANPLG